MAQYENLDSAERQRLQFYLKARSLPDDILPDKLKSNMGIMAKIMSEWSLFKLIVPKKEICQYCFIQWHNTNHNVEILPAKKPGKRISRIKKKIKQNRLLTRMEEKLFANFHPGNWMEITCLVCRKKVKFPILKPTRFIEKPKKEETPSKKKRRKRSKQKNAGIITPVNIKKAKIPCIDIDDTIVIDDDSIDVIEIPMTESSVAPYISFSEDLPGKEMKTPNTSKDDRIYVTSQKSPSTSQKKIRIKKYVKNPFAVTPVANFIDTPCAMKERKRISSLRKLLNKDSHKSSPTSTNLKDFLKRTL